MDRLIPAFAFALALTVTGVAAGDKDKTVVYKTTGADGVNVYSQTQTNGAESRQMDSRDPDVQGRAATGSDPAAVDRARQEACATARANLAAVDSDAQLMVDRDGDGANEEMTADERAAARRQSQSQIADYCG